MLNSSQALPIQTSARNLVEGTEIEVEAGQVAAVMNVGIDAPAVMTSLITEESVRNLDLKTGDRVKIMVKSASVMIVNE